LKGNSHTSLSFLSRWFWNPSINILFLLLSFSSSNHRNTPRNLTNKNARQVGGARGQVRHRWKSNSNVRSPYYQIIFTIYPHSSFSLFFLTQKNEMFNKNFLFDVDV